MARIAAPHAALSARVEVLDVGLVLRPKAELLHLERGVLAFVV